MRSEKETGGFGQCAFCKTDFETDSPIYVVERKGERERLVCPKCLAILDGEPRYSVEELEKIRKSEWMFSCNDSNVNEFIEFLGNPVKVKEILEKD
jgi:hypothetical protein